MIRQAILMTIVIALILGIGILLDVIWGLPAGPSGG